MPDQKLEILLYEKAKAYNLEKTAFDHLGKILMENVDDKDFLCGFDQNEIKAIFDGFEYHVGRRHGDAILRTRIGLYVENQIWFENLEPIGYYELETDFEGEILDDWFVINKDKG